MDLIIKVAYGGLGDHLFWSHIPRIAKQTGRYNRVLISNKSDFRNPDYKHLIWELNPYIDGFSNKDAPVPRISTLEPGMNLLDRLMIESRLDDGQRYHEPELYYQPRILSEFSQKVLYDPNYVSFVGQIDLNKISSILKNESDPIMQFIPLVKTYPVACAAEEIKTTSIYHYCDIIMSCKKFFCLASGGATLASALGRSATVFYGHGQAPMFQHSRRHRYVCVPAGILARWQCHIKNAYQRIARSCSSEVR